MTPVFMRCGHATTAVDGSGHPVCPLCQNYLGRTVAETQPVLEGRVARCWYDTEGVHKPIGRERAVPGPVPSSLDLPFFEYRPGKAEDGYYCGCQSWD